MSFEGLLHSLPNAKNFSARRISSYDVSGGNGDAWPIQPGETKVLAEIDGPGVISHIWFTISSPDKHHLRKLILRIYWDGESNPSVDSPVGDFFGLGHSRSYSYQCAFFNTSSHGNGQVGSGCAMNCWLPMPFRKHARLEIVNEQAEPVRSFYFYIDHQLHKAIDDDALYLHAKWRRDNPCEGWKGKGSVWASPEWHKREAGPEGKNLSDKNNYLILDAEGRGHYVGVNMSIDHLYKGWYGEGDDMFFVDGESWPPSLHGTGTEDYFAHAWGMQANAHLYNGQSWAELEDFNHWGKVCVYRYHVMDPVPFTKKLRVSIEHGHANDRSDDYSSCVYWYQTEPHKEFAPMPPVEARLPNI
ncbi:MAG TPA: DUF2961 domain-containing protein [Candidatus Brocadiia bacterium]|nr:DUF2961 domain-containing protein [Candidatus Brocadiia bacterium]